MTADEARRASEQAIAEMQEQQRKNYQQELERRQKADQELLTLLPQRLEAARVQIKKATNNGVRAVMIEDNENARILLEHIKAELVKDGYNVGHIERHVSRENWGDSSAPCVVERGWVEMQVSW
jgi:phosphoribosylaminoimidazole (AIR) synthetase